MGSARKRKCACRKSVAAAPDDKQRRSPQAGQAACGTWCVVLRRAGAAPVILSGNRGLPPDALPATE